MTRFPPIAPADRTSAQADMVTRAQPGGPFEMYQRSPELWTVLQPVRQQIAASFTLRQREIAVLAVAAHWRASQAMDSHRRVAREAGLADAVVEAVIAGGDPDLPEEERLLLACTRSLLAGGRLPDALFATAEARLGARMLVDLTGLVGFYTGLSLVLNLGEEDAAALSA